MGMGKCGGRLSFCLERDKRLDRKRGTFGR